MRKADATASILETATFADYMRREDAVFREVRDRIERTSAGSAAPTANRYDRRSRSHPSRIGWDGNRTYEIVPAGEIAGGALLVREAGGHVTDAAGSSDVVRAGGVVAANAHIHRLLLAALAEAGPKA